MESSQSSSGEYPSEEEYVDVDADDEVESEGHEESPSLGIWKHVSKSMQSQVTTRNT